MKEWLCHISPKNVQEISVQKKLEQKMFKKFLFKKKLKQKKLEQFLDGERCMVSDEWGSCDQLQRSLNPFTQIPG